MKTNKILKIKIILLIFIVCALIYCIRTTTHNIDELYHDLHQVRRPENTITNKVWLVYNLKRLMLILIEEYDLPKNQAEQITTWAQKNTYEIITEEFNETTALVSSIVTDYIIADRINEIHKHQNEYNMHIAFAVLGAIDSLSQVKNKGSTESELLFPIQTYIVLRKYGWMYKYSISEQLKHELKSKADYAYKAPYEHLNLIHPILVYEPALHNELIKHAVKNLKKYIKKEKEYIYILIVLFGITLLMLAHLCWREIGVEKKSLFGATVLLIVYLGIMLHNIFLPLLTVEVGIETLAIHHVMDWETNNIQFVYLNKSIWDILQHTDFSSLSLGNLSKISLLLLSVCISIFMVAAGLFCIWFPNHQKPNFIKDIHKLWFLVFVDILVIVFLAIIMSLDGTIESSLSHNEHIKGNFIYIDFFNEVEARVGVHIWILAAFFSYIKNKILYKKFFKRIHYNY